MLNKVDVPMGYDPRITYYQRKGRDSWVMEYYLPATKNVKVYLSLSKKTSKTKIKTISKKKSEDLLKGLLTDREFEKMKSKLEIEDLSIDEVLKRYMEGTFLGKSNETREKERTTLPKKFSYFQKNLKLKNILEVKESHILKYRDYLLQRVEEGAKAPSTAQTDLAIVKKVFNWLKLTKKITFNPVTEVPSIRIKRNKKVRSNTFSSDQIIKIMQASYTSTNNFPIKAFFLWLRETGCRLREALHLEWPDIKNGVWRIEYKPNCPTKFGLGWGPKWDDSRNVYLSRAALKILEYLPKVPSVGYIKNNPIPIQGNFIFVAKDYNFQDKDKWRRVDRIDKTWRSLLKEAGVPYKGEDALVRHDLRRTWNREAQDYRGIDIRTRSEQMGNSERVNKFHYAGECDNEINKAIALIAKSSTENLTQFL